MRAEVGGIDLLFVLTPRSLLLDLAGPAEAFRLTNQHLQRAGQAPCFRLRFTGARHELASSVGLGVNGLETFPDTWYSPTWVVVIGQPSEALIAPDRATLSTARAGHLQGSPRDAVHSSPG